MSFLQFRVCTLFKAYKFKDVRKIFSTLNWILHHLSSHLSKNELNTIVRKVACQNMSISKKIYCELWKYVNTWESQNECKEVKCSAEGQVSNENRKWLEADDLCFSIWANRIDSIRFKKLHHFKLFFKSLNRKVGSFLKLSTINWFVELRPTGRKRNF